MADILLPEKRLKGEITPPGSKSIAQRVMLIATYLKKPLRLINFPRCRDALTMLESLRILGFVISSRENELILEPPREFGKNKELFIRDSATALRFLLVRTAFLNGIRTRIRISDQLKHRPVDRLVDFLNRIGAHIRRLSDGFTVTGCQPQLRSADIDTSETSQYVSALLLSAPAFRQGLDLELTGSLVSRSYLDLTVRMMDQFGVSISITGGKITIPTASSYRQFESFEIEPDASSACYFWALGALTQSGIRVKGIPRDSAQPDLKFLKVLRKMGALVEISGDSISVKRGDLVGIDTDMSSLPDQVPTLAFLALFASSPTTMRNVIHLRHKESDRLQMLVTELGKIGSRISLEGSDMIVNPMQEAPLEVNLSSAHDHRLALIFSLLQVFYPKLVIDDRDCIAKSYPDFDRDLSSLTLYEA